MGDTTTCRPGDETDQNNNRMTTSDGNDQEKSNKTSDADSNNESTTNDRTSTTNNNQDAHTREKLFDFIALLQGRRMDDQRAILKPST